VKKILGVLFIILWPLHAAGEDKSKKAYELIYQDVQLLKQQYQRLEKKINDSSDDIKVLKDQIKDLTNQFKLFQTEQARVQENLKDLPAQAQILLEKLGQIDAQLMKIMEELLALKSKPVSSAEKDQETQKKEEKAPSAKKPKDSKKGEQAKEKQETPAVPPPSNLSPQEVYNTAYADYQKGSYDLAIDGFKIYREQFPASPLADNALYMIGECYFTQKKFNEAIEQLDDLIMTYPLSDKIAAAYLKKGFSLAELNKKEEAVAVLKLLVAKFPLEEEAKTAQQKIKELQERK
jgi:tol-pal system protein YbgF